MKTTNHIEPMIHMSRIFLSRAARLGGMAGTACLLLAGATGLPAQTPVYQWNFNGATGTGVPSITAGGGTLSTLIGAGSFTGAGATGLGTDWAYQGTSASDGCRNAGDLSGLGTISNLTVTFWINPAVAYASLPTTLARLLMLGNASSYDESAGNASPGFSLALNGTGLQYNINNGSEPIQANVFTPYSANQWVFVVMEYDGLATTNFSSALGAALGNSSGNLAFITGTTTASIGSPIMENLPVNGKSISPGPITNTAPMYFFVGNRASGGRGFDGLIDNINIYTNLLTLSQLESLRISGYATTLTAGAYASAGNPVPLGTTVILSAAVGGGNAPYTYQWQADGGSGTLTNIPGATLPTLSVNTANSPLGYYQYAVVVTDHVAATVTSSTLAVQVIEKIAGTLVDTGTTNPPSAGSYDACQLLGGQLMAPGLNYNTWASTGSGASPGQTFTTGNNAKGYSMSSVALIVGVGANAALAGALATATNNFHLYLYSISPDGTTAIQLADITNSPAGFALNAGDWLMWSFAPIQLQPNTVYAFAIKNFVGNSAQVSTSPGSGDAYAGGQAVSIPAAGGTVVYNASGMADATFDVGLIPNGVSVVANVPVATPNPAYALSTVKLTDTAATPGTFTYRWLTDDGTGAIPPNYLPLTGANSTNVTVIPQDCYPGGGDYTTNYYFVATSTFDNSSATSSVVTLTVHAASIPQFTAAPAPTNTVTFVGDNRIYAVTETGTLPITNQWQFDNGGGWVSLTTKTNTSLTLNNVQTTDSGTYKIGATNLLGNASAAVTLTVVPAPAVPPAGPTYAYAVYTNHPWAYWRLNETNDPTAAGAPTYTAYDYSGHGFYPLYGSAVTVSNAGPQPPSFPGLATNELAAGTAVSTVNSSLTVPALNLAGNGNITFMAWINPNGPQSVGAGLLINRGGPDGACGFGFGNSQDHLGYIWNNNNANTYNWDSGLAVADNQWNFVAYVITPTNAAVYLGNLNNSTTNFMQANNAIAHTTETFKGGTILLGADLKGTYNNFNGLLTEAALFTNALTSAQVQQYFLVGIGAHALVPTIGGITASPATITMYSGQNVRLSANASGTEPLSYQWQASSDANTWTNLPGATSASALVNPLTVGLVFYQLVVTNVAGSSTSAWTYVQYNDLPPSPAGLWTANFQVTNNILTTGVGAQGTGHYVGRGILGGGTFWNALPCVVTTQYAGQNMTNATDFLDDGVTHSGVSCLIINGAGKSSSLVPLTDPSDVGNLLNQYVTIYYSPNALQFLEVPAGTYNLVAYGIDGTYQDRGATFVVHGANGDQTNGTLNAAPSSPLALGNNFVVFTNIHVSAGVLNVDVWPTTPVPTHDPNTEADINGAQLQLVSYDPPAAAFSGTPTNIFVTQRVTFTNTTTGFITNAVWSFGDGQSLTNASTAGVSHSYAGVGTYTVTLTVAGPGGTSAVTRTGYIVASPSPTIGSALWSGGNLVLSGANGPAGQSYRILTATNLMLPLAGWTPVATNTFAPDGSYSFTSSPVTNAAGFFRLVSP
jgi:PKD repeat protein